MRCPIEVRQSGDVEVTLTGVAPSDHRVRSCFRGGAECVRVLQVARDQPPLVLQRPRWVPRREQHGAELALTRSETTGEGL